MTMDKINSKTDGPIDGKKGDGRLLMIINRILFFFFFQTYQIPLRPLCALNSKEILVIVILLEVA